MTTKEREALWMLCIVIATLFLIGSWMLWVLS